ncbi:SGNH/GDSL hydrolase family protein [Nocardia stercoris]|uniref:SGNH/GDSL hydrolase family protein n=1 Tax=Nocardia stercoris TaxID=2483361 RepID=A0A3M2KSH5_9NOCA|nr:SGNH/GDSL hydrolase family protein [Nocardia stercoris]RMI28439.1 SGNH/GDSL hydrolase family protein [Nocardia stercoris]
MKMPGKRLGWIGLAVVAAATQLGTATAAHADETGGAEIVTLGDSYSSNPQVWDPATGQFDGLGETVCSHKPDAWPGQLSRLAGVAGTSDFVDESCSGAALQSDSKYTPALEAKAADKVGAFGPRTKLVTLQFGVNDTWPDENSVTGEVYAHALSNVVAYVKYYAPNAKIVILGYPEMFGPGCVDVLGLGEIPKPDDARDSAHMDHLDTAARQAAQLLGVDFLDVRALTAGHGSCAPDPWVNGLFNRPEYRLGWPFHPTVTGDAVVAQALAAQLGM